MIKRYKPFITSLLVIIMLFSMMTTFVYADILRQGNVGAMYYTHRLHSGSWWPGDDVKGYTGTSHVVDQSYITNGTLAGTSYCKVLHRTSADSMERTRSIVSGTNHSETGWLELEGYDTGVTSTHKSIETYPDALTRLDQIRN